jgi:hypothetical protein
MYRYFMQGSVKVTDQNFKLGGGGFLQIVVESRN